ncbi:triacylglycerol lipase precursor [Scheffersomyces stipitis CBS 6054]|uniref:triacylglycerol lipase n=1 Tax=Scheffersomyces stipitis (strain ATCC 58785 / CBS 6054 / NBRC 10063 / NRRL Y-11545) TaxID=322104 RepID=A3GG80_PICST|nr:triacylglycerol lipase precursor [Scheffersomyces stipitis CBS 6054]EAZ63889.1 triacylglycerol lipase precursor [Scheffersomyces stipitis CBS 6054]
MKLSVLIVIASQLFAVAKSISVGRIQLDPRDKNPPDYNKLVEYAHLTSFAYCIKRGLTTGLLGDKDTNCPKHSCQDDEFKNIEVLKTFNFNKQGNVGSGYIAIDEEQKRILLVYRGTASRSDWVSDMDFYPVNYTPYVLSGDTSIASTKSIETEGCRVHKGFYSFIQNNFSFIYKFINSLKKKHPDYQVVLSGHSLGAALAVLTGIEFQLMGHDPLIVTYAGPKLGNDKFAEFTNKIFQTTVKAESIDSTHDFQSGLIRIVHYLDIVPSLPPSPYFKHAGYEYYIDKSKLPHEPSNLQRPGVQSQLDIQKRAAPGGISLGKLWPEWFGKYEHTHYFIKVTGCEPEDDENR